MNYSAFKFSEVDSRVKKPQMNADELYRGIIIVSNYGIKCNDKVKESEILMKSINISLPDGMRAYVEEQVADGGATERC